MKTMQLLFVTLAVLIASRADAGNCQWRTPPTNVVFGLYSAFGSGSLTAVSSYTFRCTPNTEGVLTFTTGANATSYFPRYMAGGAYRLPYNLYDDAANTVVVGDGTGGTTTRVVFNSTPLSKDFTDSIYAAAPQSADVAPGIYTDTVTAILTWDRGAGRLTASFIITTTVQAECTVSTTAVNFGNYDPVGANVAAPLDGTGAINVNCTAGTVGTVALGNGANFAGGTRRMAGPAGSFLTYELYRNAGRSSIWGTPPNTMSGTSTSSRIPIGGGFIVYGRVPAAQDPLVGVHSDTVQATVDY